MVFPFTLKGFPRKFGVLISVFIFSYNYCSSICVGVLFTYTRYYSHIWYYSRIWLLFIRRQETLLESSVRAVEVDRSGTQHP